MLTNDKIKEINDNLQECLSFIKNDIDKILKHRAQQISPTYTVISHDIDFLEDNIEIDAEYSCPCYAEAEYYNPDKYLRKEKRCSDSCGRESDWFTLDYAEFISYNPKIDNVIEELPEYITHIRNTIKQFYKLHGWNIRPKNNAYIRDLKFKEDYILIETEIGCGCCSGDFEFHKLPYDCFVDPTSYFCFMKLRGDFEKQTVAESAPLARKPARIIKAVKVPRNGQV